MALIPMTAEAIAADKASSARTAARGTARTKKVTKAAVISNRSQRNKGANAAARGAGIQGKPGGVETESENATGTTTLPVPGQVGVDAGKAAVTTTTTTTMVLKLTTTKMESTVATAAAATSGEAGLIGTRERRWRAGTTGVAPCVTRKMNPTVSMPTMIGIMATPGTTVT